MCNFILNGIEMHIFYITYVICYTYLIYIKQLLDQSIDKILHFNNENPCVF